MKWFIPAMALVVMAFLTHFSIKKDLVMALKAVDHWLARYGIMVLYAWLLINIFYNFILACLVKPNQDEENTQNPEYQSA
mmetsp:Transcript_24551/g.21734  ORF Transcript_24551/g.21734 Transcript_24551/m.21734 type:complete len:80 (+) Transcript_24551:136-375(+)